MQRFGVSASAGTNNGRRYVVWDRVEHKVASWHRTPQQAIVAAKKRNSVA